MNQVALPLAHPLTPEQVERAGGADVRMYRAGDTIILSPAAALTVIRAGWAQVDPNDQAAVAAALAVTPPDAGATAATPPPDAGEVTVPAQHPYGDVPDASGT